MKPKIPRFLYGVWCTLMLLFLSSCASTLNSRYSKVGVNIYPPMPVSIVYEGDTIFALRKVTLTAERSSEPLKITVIEEKRNSTMIIDAQNSTAYYMNIFNLGIGFAKDHNDPKRYTYPQNIYYTPQAGVKYRKKRGPHATPAKGEWKLQVSIPAFNHFMFRPGKEFPGSFKTVNRCGGIEAGISYYHTKNQFVNFSAGIGTSFFDTEVTPYDYGEHADAKNSYFSLSNNHHLSKYFSLGYGISYTRNHYHRCSDEFILFPGEELNYQAPWDFDKSYKTVGLIIPFFFHYKSFIAGLQYYPSFYRPELDKKFNYEHYINMTVGFKFHLNSKKAK